MHFYRTAQPALLQDLSKFQTFDIRRKFSRIDWFSIYDTRFGVSEPFSPNFDPFGRIWKFFHFCKTAKSALLLDLSKLHTLDICRNFSRIDWFSYYNTTFGVSAPFFRSLDPLGRILKFCISTEQRSQLFCRIYRNFKLLIFVEKFSRIDWFSYFNTKFGVSAQFFPSLDPFDRIWKFCIFAEQLSQLFCSIYQNIKFLIFVEI